MQNKLIFGWLKSLLVELDRWVIAKELFLNFGAYWNIDNEWDWDWILDGSIMVEERPVWTVVDGVRKNRSNSWTTITYLF